MEPKFCPDCGHPLNQEQTREIGRAIRKVEVAMSYADRPEEYAALPDVLGRPVGEWNTTEKCSSCPYETRDGQVTRRGRREEG